MKKNDWLIVREAEESGYMVSMTSLVERTRTVLNNQLMAYFRQHVPKYMGYFDEGTEEDVLFNINEYIKENKVDMNEVDFPYSSGSEIYLLPITENLKLKILVVDEYHGDGDYSKYISVDFFLINDYTNEKDVDSLIKFIHENLNY